MTKSSTTTTTTTYLYDGQHWAAWSCESDMQTVPSITHVVNKLLKSSRRAAAAAGMKEIHLYPACHQAHNENAGDQADDETAGFSGILTHTPTYHGWSTPCAKMGTEKDDASNSASVQEKRAFLQQVVLSSWSTWLRHATCLRPFPTMVIWFDFKCD